jgi:hypothetical protein
MRTLALKRRWLGALVIGGLLIPGAYGVYASDHLDTPTVIADPSADIADVFAWTSADGRRLNLIMTIVGRRFSDRLQYVFHVGSGERFGATTTTTSIICRFDVANIAECWAGEVDYLHGDASAPDGLEGQNRHFRVFAGLRDDPFFNNVTGTREALTTAAAALGRGTPVDEAGWPSFDGPTSQTILDQWRHTSGGPATNFLAGWKVSALVVSIDLDVVATGGKWVAVWGAICKP